MFEEHIIKLFRTYYIGREWCLNCTILNTNAFSVHEALQRLKIRRTELNKACKDGSFLTSLLWGKRWIFFSCILAAWVCFFNYGMLWAAVEPEIQSRYQEQKDQENTLRVCSWDGLQGNSLFCLCPTEECFPFWKRIMQWWFHLLLYLKILILVWNYINGRLRMLHRYFPFGSNCNCYWLFPALKSVITFATPFPWPQLFSGLVWKSCW